MGSCLATPRARRPNSSGPSERNSGNHGGVAIGKNQTLRPEKVKWKSDVPLTDGQLRSKRDEFWDTAPAFDGRKEIWDALRAAAIAAEQDDHMLAQAIIDGASITLPNGTLTECYDELGNRYQLPVYCLSAPSNMIEEASESDPGGGAGDVESPTNLTGIEVLLKLRLSTGKDVKLPVRTTDSVLHGKRKLCAVEQIEPQRQRWFFGGRLLQDKTKIEEAKIPSGFVVQVVVAIARDEPTPVDS